MSCIDFSVKAVEMVNITKRFGNFTANDNISLTVHKGEIHALLGENGAGKSTLMNQLYGLIHPDAGEILISGKPLVVSNPYIAIKHGIGMVHQHFMLVQPFTVAENIILGMETVKKFGIIDMKKATTAVKSLSEKYGLLIDPFMKIQDITVGMQQRVEILKALYRGADILILDEPTAVLTPQEIEDLIKIMRNLALEGKTIIIITHKLKEIKKSADYCTIIRRGKLIDTVKVDTVSENDLAAKMVGREVLLSVNKTVCDTGEIVLTVDKLCVSDNRNLPKINDISFNVHRGEILGIAGVDGNGQTELVEAITGLRKSVSGRITISGKNITNLPTGKIIKNKIASIPEDRQKRGLVMDYSVSQNMILKTFHKTPFSFAGILKFDFIKRYASELIKKFDIRPTDESQMVKSLSGGNQQKVIIAREITSNPDLLIAVQPTRGLDVGAIEYIHKELVNQRNAGKAVLLVSLELDEIMNLSDRIIVMYEGRIAGEVNSVNADEETLGLMMAGCLTC